MTTKKPKAAEPKAAEAAKPKAAEAAKPKAAKQSRTIATVAAEVDALKAELAELSGKLKAVEDSDHVVGIVRSTLPGGRVSETLVTAKGRIGYRTLPRHAPAAPPPFQLGEPVKLK